MIDKYTFGRTPAAMYLARRLIELDSDSLTRSCTVRINTFNHNVACILEAVDNTMPAKVGANLLRLLREEATTIQLETSLDDDIFVSQLLRNVIIGRIKQAIRKCTVVRKVQTAGINLDNARIKARAEPSMFNSGIVYYVAMGHKVGVVLNDTYHQVMNYPSQIDDEITPDTLMAKSNKRCARQGKPHMATNHE